jgi:riboflavin kinase, archaea type
MPRPEDTFVLREIAQLGALHGLVEISTAQLASLLGLSQQTASRRILELEQSGYIRREMGLRRQLVRLTEEGINVLAREYASYQKLFENRNRLQVRGTVASGLGEGRYYLAQPGYVDQFRAKLGFTPYPGTLNLQIEGRETSKLRLLKSSPSILIEGFQAENRTFGAVDAWRARIGDVACAVILPQRTHHARTLEVISAEYLRGLLKLEDGKMLDVDVLLA